MNWLQLDVHATEPLFFRNARPMQGGSAGEGARWPLPQTLHGAVMTSLYRTWPEVQDWESNRPEELKQQKSGTALRFGDLRSVGPLPVRGGNLYIPTPADIVPQEQNLLTGYAPMRLPESWAGNLPAPLGMPVGRTVQPSKQTPPPWMRLQDWQHLQSTPDSSVRCDAEPLYQAERTIGIALDAESGTTQDGKLYQAEKLRLAEDVHLRAWLRAPGAYLKEWGSSGRSLLFGGESVAVRTQALKEVQDHDLFSATGFAGGLRVKWTLISPALFRAGWRPAWVDESGAVRLPAQDCPRGEGETRSGWRKRRRDLPSIGARLVAALIPSPLHVSGWQTGEQAGPKKTERLVAAGAVYYFECTDEAQARMLVQALTLPPRSDSLGEKGYGCGLCSTWEPLSLNSTL